MRLRQTGGERIDPRAPVFLDGENLGPGLQSIVDILTTTDEPVVVTVSNRSFFAPDWKWGRIDVTVGQRRPFRNENSDGISFQLPADPEDAVYISEWEQVLREIPADIPIDDQVSFRDKTRDGAEIAFNDLERFSKVYVSMQVTGAEIFWAEVTIAKRPRPVRLTLDAGGRDPSVRWFSLESGRSLRLAPRARFLDLAGNPVTLKEFDDLQHQGQAPVVAQITLDPASGLGVEARLMEYHEEIEPGRNQVILGLTGGLHRGFWVNHQEREIGNQSFNGILTSATVVRTGDGREVSRAVVDYGARMDVVGTLVGGELFMRRGHPPERPPAL